MLFRSKLKTVIHGSESMKSVGMAARLRAIAVGIAASMTLLTAAQAASQIDNTALSNEADGTNWAANGRTFSEQHFSPLTQINPHNLGRRAERRVGKESDSTWKPR